MCVCDKLNWMENGWMDWIEWMWKVDSGKWRGSGSHTTLEGKFEWTPFIVHYNFD